MQNTVTSSLLSNSAFYAPDRSNAEYLAPAGAHKTRQIHSAVIIDVSQNDASASAGIAADGMISTNKTQILAIQTADCIPALFAAESKIAAVHAGWKGVLSGILPAAAKHFLGLNTKVALGPSIKPCCFEISIDLQRQFTRAWQHLDLSDVFPKDSLRIPKRGDGIGMDLTLLAKRQLIHSGIREENIDVLPHCSYCGENPKFASFRRATHESKDTGTPISSARQWSTIGLF